MVGKRDLHPAATGNGWLIVLGASLLALGLELAVTLSAQTQTSIQQLFEQAQRARARGNLEQAAHTYQEVIRRDPQFVNAYHNLGIVYLSQRKYQDAIAVLEKAVKLNPRLAGAYVVLGLARYELNQADKAVLAFTNAHRLDSRDTNALFFLGKAQMQLGHYRDAAATLEKLSQAGPKDPDVLYNLALAHLKLLLAAADELNSVAPNSYRLSLLEAQDAEGHNNDAAASQYYKEALSLKPDAVGIHYALGIIYSRAGRFEQAAEEFKSELHLNPNDSLALWRLGDITLRTSPSEAAQYLQQAVNLNPEFPQAVLAYGRALLRTGETEKALEQFQRVVKLAPEEDTVHYLLANAYRKLGRQADSGAEMDKFQQLARTKSAQHEAAARELAGSGVPGEPVDLEPGFSPSRQPVHP